MRTMKLPRSPLRSPLPPGKKLLPLSLHGEQLISTGPKSSLQSPMSVALPNRRVAARLTLPVAHGMPSTVCAGGFEEFSEEGCNRKEHDLIAFTTHPLPTRILASILDTTGENEPKSCVSECNMGRLLRRTRQEDLGRRPCLFFPWFPASRKMPAPNR